MKNYRRLVSIILILTIMFTSGALDKEIFAANGSLLSIPVSTTRTGHYSTNSNSNFSSTINYDDGNYSGIVNQSGINWTQAYLTQYINPTKTITQSNQATRDNSIFASTYSYSDGSGYTGTLTQSGVSWSTNYNYYYKSATASSTSSSSSFSSTYYYNDGVYSGSIPTSGSPYVISGSAPYVVSKTAIGSTTVHNACRIDTYSVWTGTSWVSDGQDLSYSSSYYSYSGRSGWEETTPGGNVDSWQQLTPPSSPSIGTRYKSYTASYYAVFTQYSYTYSADTRVWKQNYSGQVSYSTFKDYTGTATYTGQASRVVTNGYDGVASYTGTAYQKLNAIVTPNNSSYTLSSLPGTESITVSGIQTYDVNLTIGSVKVSVWKGATKVMGDYLATLSSTSGYYKAWNNVTFTLPTSLGDGSYVIKVGSYSTGGALSKEITYNLTVQTPINLKGYINSIDVDSGVVPNLFRLDTFSVNATTSVYGANVKVKFPFKVIDGGTTFAANTEIPLNYTSTSGNTKFYNRNFLINDTIADGSYPVTFVSYATNYISTEKQTKTMNVQIFSLKFNTLSITNAIKPSDTRVLPLLAPFSTPYKVKSGYNIEVTANVQGASEVILDFYSGGLPISIQSNKKSGFNQVRTYTNTTNQTSVPITLYFDDLALNSIVDIKVSVKSPTGYIIVDDIIAKNAFKMAGTFREDFNVNLIR